MTTSSSTITRDPCAHLGTSLLRMKLALQVFRRAVLGTDYDPSDLQLERWLTKLQEARVDVDASLDAKTLQNWGGGRVNQPKGGTSEYLDQAAQLAVRLLHPADGSLRPPARGYFQSLQSGGLLRHLWNAARKSSEYFELLAAAAEYEPVSPLHLHLDAIEVAALDEGCGRFTWQALKLVAAVTVLTCLHRRWSRRGTAYAALSSRQRLKGETAESDEAAATPAQAVLLRHRRQQVDGGAQPDWTRIPIDVNDVADHALKTLVSLAGDSEFWVADRLEAWSLDLTSAHLATGALLWCDRYRNFWGTPGNTLALWTSLATWFPFQHPKLREEPQFAKACDICGLPPGDSEEALRRAWKAYGVQLAPLGLSAEAVQAIAARCQGTHPLGKRKPGAPGASADDQKAGDEGPVGTETE